MKYGVHVFRRHQCRELGFEWHCGCLNADSRESCKEFISKVKERVRRSLYGEFHPMSDVKFFTFKYETEDEYHGKNAEFLRELNIPYMDERKKWPTLVRQIAEVPHETTY